MITGISIENFKGIRERVDLPLRPVTLLFGPNSAGKSSIIHALHYAREIFERRNFDPDRTVSGGPFIDLGGFANLVHGRDPIRSSVVLGFELRLNGMPNWFLDSEGQPDRLPAPRITSANVEVTIAWSDLWRRPYVASYVVALNGAPFARIRAYPDRAGAVFLDYLNVDHPVITMLRSESDDDVGDDDAAPDEYSADDKEELQAELQSLRPETAALHQSDALPEWNRLLDVRNTFLTSDQSRRKSVRPSEVAMLSREDLRSMQVADGTSDERDESVIDSSRGQMACFLSRYIVGPGRLLADRLKAFQYLGPIRETLPRNFEPVRFTDPTRWPSGLGAWDDLHLKDESLVRHVSSWLADSDRLDAGYELHRQSYTEVDLGNPLINQLLTGRAFDESAAEARIALERLPTRTRLTILPTNSDVQLQPHDVGIGISQLIPVVVTALSGREVLSAIEQPELHVHPRLQAQLGDLFLEAIDGGRRSFLIETHSEHLILRLQRRIRETSKGTPHRGMPVRPDDVAVYYVNQEDGRTLVRRIELDDQGDFIQPWPDDFFEIDFHERFA